MKHQVCLMVVLLVASSLVAAWNDQQQQQKRILRRVIKSTPTATNLARVRLVTVRAADTIEKGAVSEISSKEAASFGQRSSTNETSTQQATSGTAATTTTTKTKSASSDQTNSAQSISPKSPAVSKTSTSSPQSAIPSSGSTNSTTTPATSTSTSTTPVPAPALSASSTPAASPRSKASERQQIAPEVELMSSAPSSWQVMSAVEAPAAALISVGTRPATKQDSTNELATSSTSSNEFSRTYSSLHQQGGKTRPLQASFYPAPPQQLRQGKTSGYQATKTQWFLPTTSTTTTPRPVRISQEPHYEQYVEQVDSAPPGQAEPFAFDFNTQDTSGNGQYRKEESDSNGVVRGSYGFRDASGLYRHVDYVADHNGFRASIRSNEPGLEGGRDSQPASIRLDSGPAPVRFTSSNNADWTAASSSGLERADLALADPDFESSHKAERIRSNFRN